MELIIPNTNVTNEDMFKAQAALAAAGAVAPIFVQRDKDLGEAEEAAAHGETTVDVHNTVH